MFDVFGFIVYEGGMKNDLKHGKGIEYLSNVKNLQKINVKLYEGYFYEDKYHGDYSRLFNPQGYLVYSGKFVDGIKEGVGKLYHCDTGS